MYSCTFWTSSEVLLAVRIMYSINHLRLVFGVQYYYDFSSRRFLSHRALAALWADSDLSSDDIFAARALPPRRFDLG
jgi:hypothetical protein